MNPWTPIGWILLAFIILALVAIAFPALSFLLDDWSTKRRKIQANKRTRNTPLAVRQYWKSGVEEYTAYRIEGLPGEDNLIRTKRYRMGFSDEYCPMLPEEWERRVASERLYLANPCAFQPS